MILTPEGLFVRRGGEERVRRRLEHLDPAEQDAAIGRALDAADGEVRQALRARSPDDARIDALDEATTPEHILVTATAIAWYRLFESVVEQVPDDVTVQLRDARAYLQRIASQQTDPGLTPRQTSDAVRPRILISKPPSGRVFRAEDLA
ncbi:MAG: phage protein Gp36 family protein [Acidobacteriota bacterium]